MTDRDKSELKTEVRNQRAKRAGAGIRRQPPDNAAGRNCRGGAWRAAADGGRAVGGRTRTAFAADRRRDPVLQSRHRPVPAGQVQQNLSGNRAKPLDRPYNIVLFISDEETYHMRPAEDYALRAR